MNRAGRMSTALLIIAIVTSGCGSKDGEVVKASIAESATIAPTDGSSSTEGDTATTSPARGPSSDASTPVVTSAPPATTTSPASGPAAVGETRSVKTSKGVPVDITLTQLVDPVAPGQFTKPDAGMRFVGIQLRYVVPPSAKGVFEDSPANEAIVIDDAKQQYKTEFAFGESVPTFNGSIRIAAGDLRLGFVLFQLPEAAKLGRLQVVPDSGFSKEVAVWDLTKPAVSPPPSPAVLLPNGGLNATVSLDGSKAGEKMDVTVTALVDPSPSGKYLKPAAGNRWVAVQVALRNTGTDTYTDSPMNSAELVDSVGQEWRPTVVTDGGAGQGFEGSVTMLPGDERVGYITFEVPESAAVAKMTFTLNSGFAQQSGEWKLAA